MPNDPRSLKERQEDAARAATLRALDRAIIELGKLKDASPQPSIYWLDIEAVLDLRPATLETLLNATFNGSVSCFVGGLVSCSAVELEARDHLSDEVINEIREALAVHGLWLKGD